MEKNTKTGILKKIAIILLTIVICYFIVPTPVNAASWLVNAGGKLINVVLQLFVYLGDGVMTLLQNNFISTDSIIVEAVADEAKTWASPGWISITLGVLLALVGLCITIASVGSLSGVGAAAIFAGINSVGGALLATSAGTILAVSGFNTLIDDIQGNFDLPQIRYTPYEIFSGKIPIFDVNFIEPMPSEYEYTLSNNSRTEVREIAFKYETVTTELINYDGSQGKAFIDKVFEIIYSEDTLEEYLHVSDIPELDRGEDVTNDVYKDYTEVTWLASNPQDDNRRKKHNDEGMGG